MHGKSGVIFFNDGSFVKIFLQSVIKAGRDVCDHLIQVMSKKP